MPSRSLYNEVEDIKEDAKCEERRDSIQACMDISNMDVLCGAALQSSTLEDRISNKKPRKTSPTHYLWAGGVERDQLQLIEC